MRNKKSDLNSEFYEQRRNFNVRKLLIDILWCYIDI